MKKKKVLIIIAVVFCLGLIMCGGKEEEKKESPLSQGSSYSDYDRVEPTKEPELPVEESVENQDSESESVSALAPTEQETTAETETNQEPEQSAGTSVTIDKADNSIAVFFEMAAAVTKDHKLYIWGDGAKNRTFDYPTGSTVTEPVLAADNVIRVFPDGGMGMGSGFAIKEDKSLWAFGDFCKFSLEDGYSLAEWDEAVQKLCKIDDNVKSVTCDGDVVAYVRQDGSVVCLETTDDCSKAQIQNITDVKEIASGFGFVMALKEDGTLWGLGNNWNHVLGIDMEAGYQSSYVQIMTDVVDVEVASHTTFVIKKDGSLWGWGDNGQFQLGIGNYEDSELPIKIMDNVASVSFRGYAVYAVTKTGELYTWGHPAPFSETGSQVHRPEKCADGVVAADGLRNFFMMIKTDGTVYTSGTNRYQQLGYATEESSSKTFTECMNGGLLPKD